MQEKQNLILAYALLIFVIIFCLVFFVNIKNQDINFCRRVFEGLVKGRYTVEKFVDWAEFKGFEKDIGSIYNQFSSEKAKTAFKTEFIKNFALGFIRGGGKLKLFTHWRIYRQDNRETVVAADYKTPTYKHTLLFTITKNGKHKLTSIQKKEEK